MIAVVAPVSAWVCSHAVERCPQQQAKRNPWSIGVLLALGLMTRPATMFILATMCVADFIRYADDPLSGNERALLFALIVLMFMLTAAGRLSVDRLLR